MSDRWLIGMDRRIRLEWLEATAEAQAAGLDPPAIRAKLAETLAGRVRGVARNSAMGKTRTVLMRFWATIPEPLEALRDEGLARRDGAGPAGLLALHWGMGLAAYPLFHHVAYHTGNLLRLQPVVRQPEVIRRAREVWGQRSTLDRAVQRILASLVDWGILQRGWPESGTPAPERGPGGVYHAATGPRRIPPRIAGWLLAAAAHGMGQESVELSRLLTSPALFPFELGRATQELSQIPGIEILAEGPRRQRVRVGG